MKTVKTTRPRTTKTAKKTSDIPARAAEPTVVRGQSPAVTAATADTASAAFAPRREITSDLIATRAYIIWEEQGRPHGRDVANWLLAESQLKQEIQSFTA
jgi:hypothetical protein